ncbi:MAG: hypothetical protein QM831_04965 [Kofleriaceae bacterium]
MRRVSLRRLLSKLTVLALSTAAPTAVLASPARAQIEEELDDDSPIDREHVDPRDAAAMLGRSLATALSELPALDGIHLATTWALSEDPLRRLAVARSLEWTFTLMCDATIIDHLSGDADPAIRAAAARAAWVRRVSPAVLDRLAGDSDADVRSIALRAKRG